MNPRNVTKKQFEVIIDKLLACAMRLYEINHKKKQGDRNVFNKTNEMLDIFNGMNKYQSEIVYKYGEMVVKIKKHCGDNYSIDIDSGSLDLYNDYRSDKSNFKSIKHRIEFSNDYRKSVNWFVSDYDNLKYKRYFQNGDTFDIKQINSILNAVKNTAEFIEQNGGTIEDRNEEVYYAGKMKITLIPVECNKVRIKIEGMKSYTELPVEYYNTNFHTKCYYGKDYSCMGVYDSNNSQWIVNSFEDPDNIIRPYKAAMEIVECLKKCSDRLHEINEPVIKNCSNKEKMKINVTQTKNDKVILNVMIMKNGVYQNCDILNFDIKYILPNGCNKELSYVFIGNDYPMTKQASEEIIALLGASTAQLYAINHKDMDYELVLLY